MKATEENSYNSNLASNLRQIIDGSAKPLSVAEIQSWEAEKQARRAANSVLKKNITRMQMAAASVGLVICALIGSIVYFLDIPLSVIDEAHSTAAESNLGNGIIEANAAYVQLGNSFGKSTSEMVKEMQRGETNIVYTSDSAKAMNVVGVGDFKCTVAFGCQEVKLVSIDLANSHCFYVRIDKSPASSIASSSSSNPSSQTTVYGSRPLKSGETTCSTSDKVSNWKVGGFPPA
ncbi:MAG: hypothetical protein HKL80_11705 [Acidimicrobiales bacterium]|nr:hypothetical protein [Acidimicrobiales bacterium]